MLDSSLFESRPNGNGMDRRKKPATLAVSTVVHLLIAGGLILIPLLQTQAVPPVAPPPPVLSMGSPVRFVKLATAASSGRSTQRPPVPAPSDSLIAPTSTPDKVAYVADSIDVGSLDGIGNGPSGGPGGGIGVMGLPGFSSTATLPIAAAPPPPPPAPVPPPAPKIVTRAPLRVSSTIQKSLLVRQVEPVYPRLAVIAKVEGAVLVEARITQAGTIDSLRVISGNPLLIPAVIEAVKQWRYEPTLLNGEPVDVITTITVNFTLN